MDRFRSGSEHPAPCGEGSAVKARTLTRLRSSDQTSREMAGKTHTFLIWLADGRRMAGGRDSVKQHSLSYPLTYIVNGVLRVFHFACVKLILLEVDEVLVRWISLCLASNFWEKNFTGEGLGLFLRNFTNAWISLCLASNFWKKNFTGEGLGLFLRNFTNAIIL